MEIHLLEQIVIIFALSTAVNLVFQKANIPAIIGFLVTGARAGPHGLGFIGEAYVHDIEVLAELGVILLLFTIGIEFSLSNLMKIKRAVLLGGSLQVGLTVLLIFAAAAILGYPPSQAVFYGFLVALSSTAIVMKIVQQRAEVTTHHGRTSLGILIYQDIVIVPMMLLTPIIAGSSADVGEALLLLLLKTAGLIAFLYVGAKWLVPKLLHEIARTRSRELFLLSILMLGLAVAWLTASLGLSLALGAFLAGLTISESEYSHHAFGNIMPVRDIFTSFFFVSIGMLLNISFLLSHPFIIGLIVLLVIAVKFLVCGASALLLGIPFQTAVLIGLMLSQVGEFSFILAKIGMDYGLLQGSRYQLFLSVTVVSMAAAPFIIMAAPSISRLLVRYLPVPERLLRGLRAVEDPEFGDLSGHLIIVGMGINGRNLARAAKFAGIQYVIIELNADTVREEQEKGEPISFGDAAHEPVLHHARVESAKALVITVGDPASLYGIIENARTLNPGIYLVVRTRFVGNVDELYAAGADDVIPEEFETSIELFHRVLMKYLVPKEDIERFTAEVRASGYTMFRRTQTASPASAGDLKQHIPDIEISAVRVKENTAVAGRTIEEMQLRKAYGINILAIKRGEETIYNLDPKTVMQPGDILFLMGDGQKMACASGLFSGEGHPECENAVESFSDR
jgi:CPA2 family monovalent cation:H+ antiporter-2